MTGLAAKLELVLKPGGHCVFVVGEEIRGNKQAHPSDAVIEIMAQRARSLKLKMILTDEILMIHKC
jgi:hypothetical protein